MSHPANHLDLAIATLDHLLYDCCGIVVLAKAAEHDPTTPSGFIALEQLLTRDLVKATRKDQQKAKAAIQSALDEAHFETLSARGQARLAAKIAKVVDKYGLQAAQVAPPIVLDGMRNIFAKTKSIEAVPLKASQVFNLQDEKAVKHLAKQNSAWIRDHWRDDVTRRARDLVMEDLSLYGGNRKQIARALGKNFADLMESQEYWQVFAGASLNKARSYSKLSTYQEAEVESYEIVAQRDERTSLICMELDGRVFTVSSGLSLINEVSDLPPEKAKKKAPWVSHSLKTDQFYFKKGEQKVFFGRGVETSYLSKSGIMYPPFHGKCRTTIVAVL